MLQQRNTDLSEKPKAGRRETRETDDATKVVSQIDKEWFAQRQRELNIKSLAQVGRDLGILMFAHEGLQIRGVTGDAFHPSVGRFTELGGVAQALLCLARSVVALDVVVRGA